MNIAAGILFLIIVTVVVFLASNLVIELLAVNNHWIFDLGYQFHLVLQLQLLLNLKLFIFHIVNVCSEFILVKIVLRRIRCASCRSSFLRDFPLFNFNSLKGIIELGLFEEVSPVSVHQLKSTGGHVLEI